jgi:hypothetical protein
MGYKLSGETQTSHQRAGPAEQRDGGTVRLRTYSWPWNMPARLSWHTLVPLLVHFQGLFYSSVEGLSAARRSRSLGP